MSVNILEEHVTIEGEVILKGTLTSPKDQREKSPAVLIIYGSGAADRDGNMKRPAMNMNIYRDLAQFITGLGFITLRYDKRGVGESQGDPYSVGMMDLVHDINTNVKFLQNHPRVDKDRIILLGHSEGCILATIANSMMPIGGLVLLGGAGTNLRDPLKYQNALAMDEVKKLKGLKGFILRLVLNEDKAEKQQEKLYARIINSKEDTIKYQLKKMPAKWFREHLSYSSDDVLKLLEASNCPVLAITGDKDVQANFEDLKKIESLGKENIKCIIVKNMDHVLKEFLGEKTIINIMKQYKNEIPEPIHPELKIVLAQWLNTFKKQGEI